MRHSAFIAKLNRLKNDPASPPLFRRERLTRLSDLDFSTLAEDLRHYLGTMSWENVTFSHCRSVPGRAFHYCLLEDSTFEYAENKMIFTHCLIKASQRSFVTSYRNASRGETRCKGNVLMDGRHRKLIVAAVYAPSHGVYYTDTMIHAFKARNILVARIFCDEGESPFWKDGTPRHPLFSHAEWVDGLYLPGGLDVVVDDSKYTLREKMEKYFIDFSVATELPLLGVCRGHQFVAQYFGAEIKNMYDPYDGTLDIHKEGNDITVLPARSRLFAVAEHKYQTQVEKQKPSSLSKKGDFYSYKSCCAHYQGTFFKAAPPSGVVVTAEASDHLVEGLEVNQHIVTYQHHHEDHYQDERFSRAVLKDFANMVGEYFNKKIAQGVEGVISLVPRKSQKRLRVRRVVRRLSVREEEQGSELVESLYQSLR